MISIGPVAATELPSPAIKTASMRADVTAWSLREVGMAVLRPALDECDRLVTPLNKGERRVAALLSRLDAEWTVYVQPRIGQDVPDFVAVHDRYGICAIEVKDWSYGKYRQLPNGRIQYVEGDGVWHDCKELPRYQAYRYRSTIFDQFFALPEDGSDPTQTVRAALVLPNFSTDHARRLFDNVQVTDAEQSIRVWGGDALEQDLEQIVRGAGCPPPKPASLERLRRQLTDSAVVAELRAPVKLSRDARNIMTNPGNARRRRVRGPAGSGKSFGLAARAATLAAEDKRVLMLTFNTTLANYLRTLVTARCREVGANATRVTCTNMHAFLHRTVEDARLRGMTIQPAPEDLEWFDRVVVEAERAFQRGYRDRFDAVLVDEGQDFTLDWWNLLRNHVVTEDGEMILVADPTQDVYDKRAWTDEAQMLGAGFSGQWTTLQGSYRMPTDIVPLANAFAARYLDGERLEGAVPDDHQDLFGEAVATRRTWTNVSSKAELGLGIGHEVVRLLTTSPELSPNDVAFVCEHHEEGLAAVEVIAAAGYPVHHIFARNDRERSRRKRRFWPEAPGVKGATIHSFKGWESPALVMGIGRELESRRLAYVAMTRIRVGGIDKPAYLSVVNSDMNIAGFQSTFEPWTKPDISVWGPPLAADRVR